MPSITLDDLKKRVEVRYEPLRISLGEHGYVEFRQALRMSQPERAELMQMQREFNALREVAEGDDSDEADMTPEDAAAIESQTVDGVERMLRLIASSDRYADVYFDLVEHDLGTLMETFRIYQESSELGEASASPAS